jgi:hypothetical protein
MEDNLAQSLGSDTVRQSEKSQEKNNNISIPSLQTEMMTRAELAFHALDKDGSGWVECDIAIGNYHVLDIVQNMCVTFRQVCLGEGTEEAEQKTVHIRAEGSDDQGEIVLCSPGHWA